MESLDATTNLKDVWKTIRNLDGRYSPRKENEVLVVDGKGYTADKDKAKIFGKMYKKVSSIPKRRSTDREIKHRNREFLRNKPREDTDSEQKITMQELERTIMDTKKETTAGEDTIPYDFIKALV